MKYFDSLYESSSSSNGELSTKSAVLEIKDSREEPPLFKISLAQWSLHRHFFNKEIESTLDFPLIARRQFGIDAVEYVNQFFPDKAKDVKFLTELKNRSNNAGVKNLLIMCDNEGKLGAKSKAERIQAIENHHKWIDAAEILGCHSIRVNADGDGTPQEQKNQMVESLSKLTEYSAERRINIIIENHGGLSNNAVWLSLVIKEVSHPLIGTLPNFGNFPEGIDIYESVEKMMPFAKSINAKSYDFDEYGNETKIDYEKMMKVIISSGYRGYVGIEYEGDNLNEYEGIKKTKALLERIRTKFSN
jgi:L-ribulose-5-phosphate 3-epimerase